MYRGQGEDKRPPRGHPTADTTKKASKPEQDMQPCSLRRSFCRAVGPGVT